MAKKLKAQDTSNLLESQDSPVSKSVTVEGYEPKAGSENDYHLEVEYESWHRGEKTSKPFVMKSNVQDYRRLLMDKARLGLTIHRIMHDPNPEVTARIQEEVKAQGGRVTRAGLAGTGSNAQVVK